ncbi:NACHT domain-containing protein [Herbaspirillum sp. NPDC087042]|uniref:NACHT domain-containing protein n=1 Tax=Herbaspirillum sp. NPDC087042 TaxID=3364004 RepID=UPI00381B533F
MVLGHQFRSWPTSEMFEQEVRRVARALYPALGPTGASLHEGRERDAVFSDGETFYIIEATCNPLKQKAIDDLEKSISLKQQLQKENPDSNFKIFFITSKDPTADQSEVATAARKKARCPVLAMSLTTFGQRLVDIPAYLEARENHPFGSIRNPDPKNPQKKVEQAHFVPIDMLDTDSRESISPSTLATSLLEDPKIYTLLGDFGAGKSMTMRFIYHFIRDAFRAGSSFAFPLYLNLRDHVGQDEPSSAIYAHGEKIGFPRPESLVRAWKAGFVHIFLDGFDEISSSRFRSDAKGLKVVRRRAMTLVRKFVTEHPIHASSLFISGRQNYFGTNEERVQAFSINGRSARTLTLNEFTLEQVQDYLKRIGIPSHSVPNWLPSRPLLVGYLAVRNILSQNIGDLAQMSRSEGWDYILDRISEREGDQIEDLGGQVEEVRLFIDRLATRARSSQTGRGPVPISQMVDIFRQLVPSSPDEAAQQLLLRMAGLTSSASTAMVATAPDQEDSREFVDSDLVDAARAGDVVRFVQHPFDDEISEEFSNPDCTFLMGELGVEVAAQKLQGISPGLISTALKVAAERINSPALAFDILRIIQQLGIDIKEVDHSSGQIVISNGYFDELELTPGDSLSLCTLKECMIDNVFVNHIGGRGAGPKLESCEIENVYGASSRDDLPQGVIDSNTRISQFHNEMEIIGDLRLQQLPHAVLTLLASLKKLFLQAGRGRKETAFPRGLDEIERAYVADVLSLISHHQFATPHRLGGPLVWIPNRVKLPEAKSILRAPQQSDHPLIVDVRKL